MQQPLERGGAVSPIEKLSTDGLLVLRQCGPDAFHATLAVLGAVIQKERVALRAGAHAYLAKPGAVPLHTDHPEAKWVAWYCEAQDANDGANQLLDARPVIEALSPGRRATLHTAQLQCPRVEGGPPVLTYPVLKVGERGERLFCSPWLRAVGGDLVHQSAIDELRTRLKERTETHSVFVQLKPGDALVIDNGRVLHGRGQISETSRRVLHRRWVA
jgi:alpha-ketoglutarate-dependent taurine dioxygenase